MAFYLAERYVPSMSPADIAGAIERLDAAAADGAVRLVLSLIVHGEDTCLSIFEAPDAPAIERVTEQVGFLPDRIVEVTAYPAPPVGSRA